MMCRCRHIATSLLLFCLAPFVYAQTPPLVAEPARTANYDDQMHSDTIVVPMNFRERSEKSDAFYDTLRYRRYKNPITQFLFRSLIRNRDASDEGPPMLDFTRNRNYFEHYSGKRIAAVRLTQANVFSPRNPAEKVSWGQRFLDKIHIRTQKKQLTQNLLFQVGDTINPYVMGINEEMLRSLPYLSTAYFVVLPDPHDSSAVIVNIFARDNWSLSADASFGSIENRISVFDRNFLGTGDEIKLTFSSEKGLKHIGTEIDYTARNLLGSFTDVTVKMGVGANSNIGQFTVEHPFILPSDWAFGFEAGRCYKREKLSLTDTTYYVNRFRVNGWIGKSWCLNWHNGTNVYIAASLGKEQYINRPPVTESLNPFYHNRDLFLFSIGFARRNYFQGNMIYGYGRTEDIPYGFRVELVGGRQWEEKLGGRDYWG
ncbi:hypothetical protein, partial [uncultured Rikenella sp.]|uniref:hypothetical protein n=1 Tax=uncultured Rikenella sp. TaxID=368003 RepID=UPI00261F2D5F